MAATTETHLGRQTRRDPSSLPQTAEHGRVGRGPQPPKTNWEGPSALEATERPETGTANAQGTKQESGDERLSDPETGVVPGVTRDRNMRSRSRCSMCPAIHINSRSWLRSSSTHEPSDPPLRVVFLRRTREGERNKGLNAWPGQRPTGIRGVRPRGQSTLRVVRRYLEKKSLSVGATAGWRVLRGTPVPQSSSLNLAAIAGAHPGEFKPRDRYPDTWFFESFHQATPPGSGRGRVHQLSPDKGPGWQLVVPRQAAGKNWRHQSERKLTLSLRDR